MAGRIRTWHWVTAAVLAGLAVVVAANAHLVIVAVTSQPDCVEVEGPHRAAKAGC